jgi:hypothetical protein
LEQVDGGRNYYARFSHPVPTRADFFPIGVWGAYAFEPSNVAKDKAVGINTYIWAADPSPSYLQVIRDNGMYAIVNRSQGGSAVADETVGRVLDDEIDMTQGASACPAQIDAAKASLPQDGRATYANYGKGVAFWQTDAQAACFINAAQDITSDDVYWHTDPYETSRPQSQRSWGYGWLMERMRTLDRRDGVIRPQWGPFVEVTNAMNGPFGPPTPAEIRGAVWHSLIAGSRAVEYFQHDFNGDCMTHHALRETGSACYGAIINMVTSVNAQVKSLAPVLNSDTVTSGHSLTGAQTRRMVKYNLVEGKFYVFLASYAGGSATFSMPCVGDATATVLGENRTVPARGGTFTDSFGDGNAVHIYRLEGGSVCGLS